MSVKKEQLLDLKKTLRKISFYVKILLFTFTQTINVSFPKNNEDTRNISIEHRQKM